MAGVAQSITRNLEDSAAATLPPSSAPKSFPTTRIDRSKIELPQLNAEILSLSRDIAECFAQENSLPDTRNLEPFVKAVQAQVAGRSPPPACTPELITLTAIFCTRLKRPDSKPVLTRFPDQFFGEHSQDAFQRAAVAVQFLITHDLKLPHALAVEQFAQWTGALQRFGFSTLIHRHAPTLISAAFPGFTDGDVPKIRPWKLCDNKKWSADPEHLESSRALAKRAIRSVLFEVGALYPDGTVNTEVLRSTEWGLAFHHEEYGLRGLIAKHSHFARNSIEALCLALPDQIGLGRGLVSPFSFRFIGKTAPEIANQRIAAITRYLTEDLLNLVDDHNLPDPEKIRQCQDWGRAFDDCAPNCFEWGGVRNVAQALTLTYPHLFGWQSNVLQPADISYSGMWKGESGRLLCAQTLAFHLHEFFQHNVRSTGLDFNPDRRPILQLTRHDVLELQAALFNADLAWGTFATRKGLTAALRQTFNADLKAAFCAMLCSESQLPPHDPLTTLGLTNITERLTVSEYLLGCALWRPDIAERPNDSNRLLQPNSRLRAKLTELLAPELPDEQRLQARTVFLATISLLQPKTTESSARSAHFPRTEALLNARYVAGPRKGALILSAHQLHSVLQLLSDTQPSPKLAELVAGFAGRRINLIRSTLQEALAVHEQLDEHRHLHPLALIERGLEEIVQFFTQPSHETGLPMLLARVTPREPHSPNRPENFGFTTKDSTTTSSGRASLPPDLIQELTRSLVEGQLKLVDARGAICSRKVFEIRDKLISDLDAQFKKGASRKHRWGGVPSAAAALKLTYPTLFGWEEHQIPPAKIPWRGMWQGPEGEKLFLESLAHATRNFFLNHYPYEVAPEFAPDKKPPLAINWVQMIQLRAALYSTKTSWSRLVEQAGLADGLRVAGKRDLVASLSAMIGKDTPSTTPGWAKAPTRADAICAQAVTEHESILGVNEVRFIPYKQGTRQGDGSIAGTSFAPVFLAEDIDFSNHAALRSVFNRMYGIVRTYEGIELSALNVFLTHADPSDDKPTATDEQSRPKRSPPKLTGQDCRDLLEFIRQKALKDFDLTQPQQALLCHLLDDILLLPTAKIPSMLLDAHKLGLQRQREERFTDRPYKFQCATPLMLLDLVIDQVAEIVLCYKMGTNHLKKSS